MNDETFPLDWNAWRDEWMEWQSTYLPSRYHGRNPWAGMGKNFMADEILGIWEINGTVVELSETVFLGSRGVGITWADERGGDSGVAHSWPELAQLLGIDR